MKAIRSLQHYLKSFALWELLLGLRLTGRYLFAKKFGDRWAQYRFVFFAGYGCGVGLAMMLSLGLVFMSKSVIQSSY